MESIFSYLDTCAIVFCATVAPRTLAWSTDQTLPPIKQITSEKRPGLVEPEARVGHCPRWLPVGSQYHRFDTCLAALAEFFWGKSGRLEGEGTSDGGTKEVRLFNGSIL
jgi:hypothetical protein